MWMDISVLFRRSIPGPCYASNFAKGLHLKEGITMKTIQGQGYIKFQVCRLGKDFKEKKNDDKE